MSTNHGDAFKKRIRNALGQALMQNNVDLTIRKPHRNVVPDLRATIKNV